MNMYRWCATCDNWNIDGAPQETQILADLDAAVAQKYQWPDTSLFTNTPPTGVNLAPYSSAAQVDPT